MKNGTNSKGTTHTSFEEKAEYSNMKSASTENNLVTTIFKQQ